VASAADGKWAKRPYLKPVIGLSTFSSGGSVSSAVSLGAEGGLRYWQKDRDGLYWTGKLRARGAYLLGTGDTTGTDLRIGNFIGPRFKILGLQTGPDVFWNQYTWDGVVLDPTTGLGWPVMASISLTPVYLNAGVEPAWYLSGRREAVDWDSARTFGFGDEFTVFGGVGLGLGPVGIGVSASRTETFYGTRFGYGVSFNVKG